MGWQAEINLSQMVTLNLSCEFTFIQINIEEVSIRREKSQVIVVYLIGVIFECRYLQMCKMLGLNKNRNLRFFES